MKDSTVLVAGASSGWGHMQAAHNIAAWIGRKNSSCHVSVLDVFEYVPLLCRLVSKNLWQSSSLHGAMIYSRVHSALIRSSSIWDFVQKVEFSVDELVSRNVVEGAVSAFIATHPIAIQLGVSAKKKLNCKLFVVATDYVLHNFQVNPNVDAYFVPKGCCIVGKKAEDLLSGRDHTTVHETGIPLSPEFDKEIDVTRARLDLRLDPERFTVVVSFGGAGLGFRQNLSLIRKLIHAHPYAQWLLLAGRDGNLYRELREIYATQGGEKVHVHVMGFAHNMARIMTAADVLVGKAGGLTVSEALRKNVPIALVDRLPGQEEYNAQTVLGQGLGIDTKDFQTLSGWLRGLAVLSLAEPKLESFSGQPAASAGSRIADQIGEYVRVNKPTGMPRRLPFVAGEFARTVA